MPQETTTKWDVHNSLDATELDAFITTIHNVVHRHLRWYLGWISYIRVTGVKSDFFTEFILSSAVLAY